MNKLIAFVFTVTLSSQVFALDSVKALQDRDTYYPGTEDLAPDEMRILACGTGEPTVRPKQAAACWIVELGNGDKFIFDIGAQSMSRISGYKIHYDFLDKVFISHLHMDHFGDLAALWIGGLKSNRTYPLRVWGPSGYVPEQGTRAAVNALIETYKWDYLSSSRHLDARGTQLQVNEFDYKGVNQVIYQENDVTIRSIPAIHAIDGAVSFILEWNGLKFAFSGDTIPNKWWMEFTKGVDVAVHESFRSPKLLIEKGNYPPEWALTLGTLGHTSPMQFGEVMRLTKPRLAIGYHFYNDFDTFPEQYQQIRKVYDGPLALAFDNMVINVTKDNIRVRKAVVDGEVWPMPARRKPEIDHKAEAGTMSGFTKSGTYPMKKILDEVWGEINREYGTDFKPPVPEKK